MNRLRYPWGFPSLMLVIAWVLTACGGQATLAAQPTQAPILSSATTTSLPPTTPPRTEAPEPTSPTPAPTVTPAPSATTAATVAPVTIHLECAVGQPWSQTRDGVTLAMCFDPRPPPLGARANFEAMLTDAAGQPITDATVELVLVGGMAGMEGEHDEDFDVELDNQGSGRYAIEAAVGPSDLVLTGISVRVHSGGQSWSFAATEADLRAP